MKRYLLSLFIVLFVLAISSCKKNSNSESGPSNFSVIIENAQGQSLLSPATPGHFVETDVKRADLIDGNEVTYYQGNLDDPKGFRVVNEAGKSFLVFTPYMGKQRAQTTTYFYWNATMKDTIECSFVDNGNGKYDRVSAVWVNKVKVFPDKNIAGYPGQGAFKIIK